MDREDLTRRDHERGQASIQTLIVWPVVLLFVFVLVQGGLWFLGRNAAFAAAQEGARAAAAERGTVGAGTSAAQSFLATSTVGLSQVSITGSRTAAEATITVSASAVSLVPGFDPTVVQTVALPVERITG